MDGGIEAILGELIEMVQATAPALWALAQRQVLANTIGNAMWSVLCAVNTIVLALVARHSERRNRQAADSYDTGWYLATVFSVFFAFVTFVLALGCLNSLIMYSINPDYYAIKVLLELVR